MCHTDHRLQSGIETNPNKHLRLSRFINDMNPLASIRGFLFAKFEFVCSMVLSFYLGEVTMRITRRELDSWDSTRFGNERTTGSSYFFSLFLSFRVPRSVLFSRILVKKSFGVSRKLEARIPMRTPTLEAVDGISARIFRFYGEQVREDRIRIYIGKAIACHRGTGAAINADESSRQSAVQLPSWGVKTHFLVRLCISYLAHTNTPTRAIVYI